jgi:hypothetical protein
VITIPAKSCIDPRLQCTNGVKGAAGERIMQGQRISMLL